jgi:predicted N-acyltransferase
MGTIKLVSDDYVIRVFNDPATLAAETWNRLLQMQAEPTPFMRHEYLLALHASASAVVQTGWAPCFFTLWRDSAMVAAAPAYLKSHSYGEYVFDWAWADAYQRHGLRYYPKLLVAVPFTPVPGSRLLAVDAAARHALVDTMAAWSRQQRVSSCHILFHDEADAQATRSASAGLHTKAKTDPVTDPHWLSRSGVQFHWTMAADSPCQNFNDFLASLHRDKRKKIAQERRRVREAGVAFEARHGAEITKADWDFFYACYLNTYQAHHSTPYLTRDFFTRVAATMPDHWLMFVASRDGEAIAASLVALDPQRRIAYGRYWGATEYVACLHFEACYYQPLAWCIANGYRRFEGGAQGEHKMARGLMPTATSSSHWLAHPAFASAVADFLAAEGKGIAEYVDELRERSPFKD